MFIPAMNDPLHDTPELLLKGVRACLQFGAAGLVERIHRHTIREPGWVRLGGDRFAIYPQPDNASVAKLVSEHPERFGWWVFLNPAHDPNVLETLERWRNEPGVVGVKLHPHWHDWETERAMPLFLPFTCNTSRGAATSVFLASSPSVADTSGRYYIRCKQRKSNPQTYRDWEGEGWTHETDGKEADMFSPFLRKPFALAKEQGLADIADHLNVEIDQD